MLHDEARKQVCLCCFRKCNKSLSLENASPEIRQRLEEHVISDLDVLDNRVPTGICSSCRCKLRNIDKEGRKSTIDIQILISYLSEQKRLSPRQSSCICHICKVANSFGAEAKKLQLKYHVDWGRARMRDMT